MDSRYEWVMRPGRGAILVDTRAISAPNRAILRLTNGKWYITTWEACDGRRTWVERSERYDSRDEAMAVAMMLVRMGVGA